MTRVNIIVASKRNCNRDKRKIESTAMSDCESELRSVNWGDQVFESEPTAGIEPATPFFAFTSLIVTASKEG